MIGAIISAAASIGGALLSSSSQKKAANQASDAQVAATRENNALVRELYGRNEANFTPWMQSGQRASPLIDSFLYGPQQQTAQPQQAGDAPYTMSAPSYSYGQPAYPQNADNRAGLNPTNTLTMDVDRMQPLYDLSTGVQLPMPGQQQVPGAVTTPQPQAQQGGNGLGGYDAFVNSPYYQNPLQEGFRALNHGLASGGMLNSGDAMKRALRYGQDYGAGRQDEFLALAGGQANRGFGAASALAGVGQNMVSDTSANNRSAADALSNAALLRGQANQNLYGGIGGALGGLLSSYKF